MAAPWEGKFSMPMYRDWVPKPIRPWLYLIFAFVFQLSGSVYLGSASKMAGTMSLMREDVMMIGMMGVVGVNMPFPFLFKFKFRYTNRQLLLNAALAIAACNVLSIYITDVPTLCFISYVAGFLKLCGTFECFSNIRLWISPKQDFGVFLPAIYIVILGAQGACAWITQQVTYSYDDWHAMQWLMTGVLLAVALLVFCLTRNFRFAKPMPLLSLDWLGCVLWSLLMIEVIWLFTYGEYYNWWDGAMWRLVFYAFPITLAVTIGRMNHIKHPYLEPHIFKHLKLIPILAMFILAEVMNATPHVMQNTLTGGVLHWGETTTSVLSLWELGGYVAGCAFVILWGRGLHYIYPRLLILGFATLLVHQVMMYFYVSPTLNIERLYVPTFLRTFGYAIFFSTMTLYLKEVINFPAFFMALTMSGFVRNGVVESIFSGLYGYQMRYHITENLTRATQTDIAQVLLVSIKQSYGVVCLAGCALLLLMLLYDVQPVRSTMKKMPHLALIRRRFSRLNTAP